MLRDESPRIVGAARGEVIPFPVPAPLRDIEKAWIHTCQGPAFQRGLDAADFQTGSLEGSVLVGLEQILAAGLISRVHLGVLVMHGRRGGRPNLNCAVATQLWTDAMKALESVVSLQPEQLQ
jgi:hypothetical protein